MGVGEVKRTNGAKCDEESLGRSEGGGGGGGGDVGEKNLEMLNMEKLEDRKRIERRGWGGETIRPLNRT